MNWAKVTLPAALLASIGVFSIETDTRAWHGFAAGKPAMDDELVNWVEKRVHELQPTRAEKQFDDIGWAKNIRDAERLAAQQQRPIFLFTHDGRMNTGRC